MLQTGDLEEANLGAGPASSDGHRAAGESRDSRLWRSVVIGEQEQPYIFVVTVVVSNQ